MIKDIGFIGLGQMGKWMALILVKRKFNLMIFDVDATQWVFYPNRAPNLLNPRLNCQYM